MKTLISPFNISKIYHIRIKKSLVNEVSEKYHSDFLEDILGQENSFQCSLSQSVADWDYMFPKSRMEETSVWKKSPKQTKRPNNKLYSPLPEHTLTFGPLDTGILDSLNRSTLPDPSIS